MKHLIRLTIIGLCSLNLFSCQPKQTTQTEERKELTSYHDLKGHTCAVLMGSVQDLSLSKIIEEKNILRLNTAPEMFAAVENNKAEYCLFDESTILCVDLESKGLECCCRLENESGKVAAAFRKDDDSLREKFNAFLAEIKSNGKLDEIIKRWSTNRIDTIHIPDIPQPEGIPLEVGTTGSNLPFSTIRANDWAGIEVEILKYFGQYIGRPVHFNDYNFSSLIAALNTNKIDVAVYSMFITEERSKQVDFSDSYYFSVTVFVGRNLQATATKEEVSLWQKTKDGFYKNVIEEDRWKMLLDGLWETLVISFWALILGTILGAGLCFLRMSRRAFWRGAAKAYIELMRGIPVLVFLMVMFYIIFSNSSISATFVAILSFAFNLAAYTCEMFRTGIESVDKGQKEAGRALGFGKVRTFLLIVVPQALKQIIPIYKGEAVSLIKNTSIVGYIAIQDLTKISDIIRSRTFDAFYPLIIISIIYLLLAWMLGLVLDLCYKKTVKA